MLICNHHACSNEIPKSRSFYCTESHRKSAKHYRKQQRRIIKGKPRRRSSCTRKQRHPTEWQAIQIALKMNHHYYSCRYCKGWHTTKSTAPTSIDPSVEITRHTIYYFKG